VLMGPHLSPVSVTCTHSHTWLGSLASTYTHTHTHTHTHRQTQSITQTNKQTNKQTNTF